MSLKTIAKKIMNKPEPAPALVTPARPAPKPRPVSPLDLCPQPAPPPHIPIASVKSFAEDKARLLALEQQLADAQGEWRTIDAEIASLRSDSTRATARQMLDVTKPLGTLGQRAGKLRTLTERQAALRHDIEALKAALEEGRNNLRALAYRLSPECIPDALRAFHKDYVAKVAKAALTLCAMWQVERDLFSALEDSGVRLEALSPGGPARPTFALPGLVAVWVKEMLAQGLLPRVEPWLSAAKMETHGR